nr:MAG TPA: hypothetical protein [Caudoviricetes sp.]
MLKLSELYEKKKIVHDLFTDTSKMVVGGAQ